MEISILFKTALHALNINRSRSFLTMLGIIIGIASVIIVLSVGQSAQNLILNQVKSIGSNLVVIFPGVSEENGPPLFVYGINITSFKNTDLDKIRQDSRVSHVVAVNGYVQGSGTIAGGNQSREGTFLGVDPEYILVEDATVESGRFFDDVENEGLARVAVIGSELAEEIFPGMNPINQKIKVKKQTFTVIGVMKKRGTAAFQNQDQYVLLPIKTAQSILLGIDYLTFARVKIDLEENIPMAMQQIRQTLREEHNLDTSDVDDFSIRTSAQALDVLGTITNAIKFFLSAVAAISLLVGGVGIMNIMFVAITERTREIGLRKALGAKNKFIVWQFVMEAMLIALVGGLIGLMTGVVLTFIIALAVSSFGYAWDFVVTPASIILSITFSLLIGFIFGIYPAVKASKLNPIEALRYE